MLIELQGRANLAIKHTVQFKFELDQKYNVTLVLVW